ncbi:MAG: P-loop NTPase, partial [Sulfolobales archaeon]
KTIVTALIALKLRDRGFRTGILDLDLTNPSIHTVLGVDLDTIKPEEERGVVPPEIQGVKLMTLAYYTRERPTPLRGMDLVNAFRELMSITLWGYIDFLLIDTPPGFSDVILELSNTLGRISNPILVSILSKLSIKPTINLYKYMKEIRIEPLGVVLNMISEEEDLKKTFFETASIEDIRILGLMRRDPEIEKAIGSINDLKRTKAYEEIGEIVREVLKIIESRRS